MAEVWAEIDKGVFAQNAILLELKSPVQGRPVQERNVVKDDNTAGTYPFVSEALLDDLALAAAGNGGKDNVTAVCLEADGFCKSEQVLTIRIARNAGTDNQLIIDLRQLLDSITDDTRQGIQMDMLQQRVLVWVMNRCCNRLRKHVTCLTPLTRVMEWAKLRSSSLPSFSAQNAHIQTPDDEKLLGVYSRTTHDAFAKLQQQRLIELTALASDLSTCTFSDRIEDLARLSTLSYLVRRSSIVEQIIQQSISRLGPHTNPRPQVTNVLERLGQLSKFARAANHITWFATRAAELAIRIKVEGTPSALIQLKEISTVNLNDIRRRSGPRYQHVRDKELRGLVGRWQRYREHAEVQLIMFYAENPSRSLVTTYIGCNKLSCFLCYEFMSQHGRFRSKGCHQTLYSLWAVRSVVNAKYEEGQKIHRALVWLSKILEEKIQEQKQAHWRSQRIGAAPESVANLSRFSLIGAVTNSAAMPPEASYTIVPEIKMSTNAAEPRDNLIRHDALNNVTEHAICSDSSGSASPASSCEGFKTTLHDTKVSNTSLNPPNGNLKCASIHEQLPKSRIIPTSVRDGKHIHITARTRRTSQSQHLRKDHVKARKWRSGRSSFPSISWRKFFDIFLDALFGKEVRRRAENARKANQSRSRK